MSVGARRAMLTELSRRGTVPEQLRGLGFVVVPFPGALDGAYFVWNPRSSFGVENDSLYKQLEELAPKKDAASDGVFFKKVGELLGYLTPYDKYDKDIPEFGYSVRVKVSFQIPEVEKTSVNQLFKFQMDTPKQLAMKSQLFSRTPYTVIPWALANDSTYYVDLAPQFVFGKTFRQMQTALQPCVDALLATKDSSIGFPLDIVSAIVSILPFLKADIGVGDKSPDAGGAGAAATGNRGAMGGRRKSYKRTRARKHTLRKRNGFKIRQN